jgi:uncharacterized protein (TIGR00251 family)
VSKEEGRRERNKGEKRTIGEETGQEDSGDKAAGEKESCLLIVRVQPGASRTEVKALLSDGSIRVRLRAPPVEGRANAELVMLLCQFFKVPASSVRIVRGLTSRQKSIVIEGMTKADAAEIVARTLESGERDN